MTESADIQHDREPYRGREAPQVQRLRRILKWSDEELLKSAKAYDRMSREAWIALGLKAIARIVAANYRR